MFSLHFVTVKQQIQFAVTETDSSIEDIKKASIEEFQNTTLESPESLNENAPRFNEVKSNLDSIVNNDLLLAITPNGECVGIKAKYGMPDTFETEQSRHEWLNDAAKRAIDLKDKIENGVCDVESLAERLQLKPKLSPELIEILISESRAGLCFKSYKSNAVHFDC